MRNYSFFGKCNKNNLTLSHSYKLHGSGLAPWLPGHSQLSMKLTLQAFQGLESWLHDVPVVVYMYNMHHEGSSPGPSRAWGGAFMAFTISWHLWKPPLQRLERRLHGVPIRCSVLYNMHHEGSSPGPGRAWGGAFMAFIFFVSVMFDKA